MTATIMKLIDHGSGGSVDTLRLADAPVPSPGPGQVLIEVGYAGVNRPDVLQRSGSYPPPPGASPYLGLEVSGRIAALGAGVTRWKVGDAVCALTPGGGYAEYCVTDAEHCLPIPQGMSMLEAAALPETYFTVWTNVFERGGLKSGQTMLVHGGSSGIGLTAIQLAHAFGARVMTTVGNEDKARACREAGADLVINYRHEDYVEVVARETAGKGVNLVLDMVGGGYIERNLRCLAIEGCLVQIAFLEGSQVCLDAMPIMLKRLTFTGSTLRARSSEQKAAIARELQAKVWPLLEQRKCVPVIHKVFPLADAREAHSLMESSAHIGKIMLAVKEA
jgi:putative PIG3 family NAD(P)H quinone oxidoreductase